MPSSRARGIGIVVWVHHTPTNVFGVAIARRSSLLIRLENGNGEGPPFSASTHGVSHTFGGFSRSPMGTTLCPRAAHRQPTGRTWPFGAHRRPMGLGRPWECPWARSWAADGGHFVGSSWHGSWAAHGPSMRALATGTIVINQC